MRIKRFIAIIIFAIIMVIMGVNVAVAENDNNKKVVKIGAFDIIHMQEKNKDGKYVGYSYDYLNALLPYTNWEYEYVEGSVSECLEWLKNGEIDIIGCMLKTPEREEIFDYVDYYLGYNGTKLLVKNDNTKYAADDYDSFDGMVVGVQKGVAHIGQIEKFSKRKGFNIEMKLYNNEAEVLDALDKGMIDAACLFDLKVEEWTRVIAIFDIRPYYYIVKKGNAELLEEFNIAIGKKKIDDPLFEENLRKKYHINESKNSIVFSNDEKKFLESAAPIKVAYDFNFMPIEGYDSKTDAPKGYTIEVLKKISQITGLEFEYITTDSYNQNLQLLINKEVDVLSSINESIVELPVDISSDYYLNLNIVLMGKSDFYFNTNDKIIIAVPLRAVHFMEEIKKVYPNCEFLFFDTGEDAYEAIANNTADLAVRNIYSAQLDIATGYQDFRIIYALSQPAQTKFLFAEDTPEELVSIFNKCIASFNESDVNAMMMTATIEQIDTEPETIRELMISVLAMVLGAFAIWLFLHLIKARRRLIYTAFYDELTGLPNLTKFKIEAKKILEENPTRAHGVLLTDIADFSLINEKYGFDVGDLIIKSVGTSLTQLKSFTTLTARISSNMFISLYVYDEVEEESISANESLHTYKYQDTFINFFHYFGRYLIPVGETDVNDIYEKASYAHLFAKKNGIKERIVDYDHEAKKNSVRNQEIEEKMYNSLEKKDFKVYLQPKYKCDGKTLVGAEALVRWFDSTTNQMIFPNDFIPLFEHNGFVIYLDFYMFEEVCKLLSQWKKSGLELITISVNFSRLHFNNTSMADTLLEITKKYDVDTKYLEIEITENALSTEVSEISEMIVKLSSYGFKISLDDFSSQNSSLLFLAEVPVNVVKLDKAFVSAISDGNANYLLVDGTIQILKKLKFVVVAEGVETNEQVQLLDKMNCDIIQGYIFSKPIPANDVEKLLSTSKA